MTNKFEQECIHSWHFDGDDPYIVCSKCHEIRGAISGEVVSEPPKQERLYTTHELELAKIEARLDEEDKIHHTVTQMLLDGLDTSIMKTLRDTMIDRTAELEAQKKELMK